MNVLTAVVEQNTPQIQPWVDNLPTIIAVTGTILGALIATGTTLLVTRMNNNHQVARAEKEEIERKETWLKDKKMRVYSAFIGNALELMTNLKDVYEHRQFEDKRYKKLLRQLRMADILILGSDEVIESYESVVLALTTFYNFIKDDQMLTNTDDLQGHLITVSMDLRSLEGNFRKDIGLEPSKSNILNYPVM